MMLKEVVLLLKTMMVKIMMLNLILRQDRQIAIRRESRDNFQAAYDRQQARFDRQLATESDLLNAQLSFSPDGSLQREQITQLVNYSAGLSGPVILTADMQLFGEHDRL